MRFISLISVLAILAACGGGMGNKSSIDRQARAQNAALQSEAQSSAQIVQVAGQPFRVAIVSGSFTTVATDDTLTNFALRPLVAALRSKGACWRSCQVILGPLTWLRWMIRSGISKAGGLIWHAKPVAGRSIPALLPMLGGLRAAQCDT